MNLVAQGLKHLHEGLNTLNYTEQAFEKREQYTWVLADVDEYEILKVKCDVIWENPAYRGAKSTGFDKIVLRGV